MRSIYTYTYMYLHLNKYICIYEYVYIHMYICIHICLEPTHPYMFINAKIHSSLYLCIHTYVSIHAYVHIYINRTCISIKIRSKSTSEFSVAFARPSCPLFAINMSTLSFPRILPTYTCISRGM